MRSGYWKRILKQNLPLVSRLYRERDGARFKLNTTKDELATTIDELNVTKNELTATSNNLHTAHNDLINAKNELAGAQVEITTIKNELNTTRAHIDQRMQSEAVQMRRLTKLTPRNIGRFQTHIVDHCNLNCAGCAHFSNLHSEKFLSVEEYRRDYERLSHLFRGEAELIEILGGEPLLHKEINSFMEIARACFPNAPVHILTNGLLLSKMDDAFWESMKKFKISLRMSRYPIKVDYDKFARICRDKGIAVLLSDENVQWISQNIDLHVAPNGHSPERNLNNFINCYGANLDFTLRNGRIYTCPQAAYAYTLKDYFNAPISISDRNSINIHDNISADEIMAFLARPIPFCHYCRVEERHPIPWKVSKREIEEWA